MRMNCDPSILQRRPAAILLDLDNTLFDYDHPHTLALAEVRKKLSRNAGIAPARFDALYDEARKSVKADLNDVASAHSRLLYFQRLIEMTGLRSDVVMALDCEQTYWRTFLSTASLFEDAEAFLLRVRSAGIPMAIVTDLTAQIQFRKIVYFGLENIIDFVVTSEEAGADKPDARIFDLVRRKLKLDDNAVVWMIGDDARKDCVGAKDALQATTFLRGRVHSPGDTFAVDAIFERFADITALVDRVAP